MFSDHQMDFETVEEAILAGLIPAPLFSVVQMAATNAVVVARRHRKAIQHVNRVLIQGFPGLTQQTKQGQEQISAR